MLRYTSRYRFPTRACPASRNTVVHMHTRTISQIANPGRNAPQC
jgi:hypothetical protein